MLAKSAGISGITPELYFKAWEGDRLCSRNLRGTVHLQAVKMFIWILAVTITRSKVTVVLLSE